MPDRKQTLPVTVQIGNSDDKLTQRKWSEFTWSVGSMLTEYSLETHFHGYSPPNAGWQNACWVVEIAPHELDELRVDLGRLAGAFDQDSIALTIGKTEFVAGVSQ